MKDIRPTSDQLAAELKRLNYRQKFLDSLKSTVVMLTVTAAVSVLAATLWLPVLQIYGSSMTPTLSSGDMVLCVKISEAKPGEVIAFYAGNKILVKRCIAGPGDSVDIREDGTVVVNGQVLAEPYISEPHFGAADVALPCRVPEGAVFVLGDDRDGSLDSRHSQIGCVEQDSILGKAVLRFWPLDALGIIE